MPVLRRGGAPRYSHHRFVIPEERGDSQTKTPPGGAGRRWFD
jgi:hypothetical protein